MMPDKSPESDTSALGYERREWCVSRTVRRSLALLPLALLLAAWPTTQIVYCNILPQADWIWKRTAACVAGRFVCNRTGLFLSCNLMRYDYALGFPVQRHDLRGETAKGLRFRSKARVDSAWSRAVHYPIQNSTMPEGSGGSAVREVSGLGVEIGWQHDTWKWRELGFVCNSDGAQLTLPSWLLALLSALGATLIVRKFHRWRKADQGAE